jgi:hypothetical protein
MKNRTTKIPPQTKKLSREARATARLCWQRAMQMIPPEVQDLLVASQMLNEFYFDCNPDHRDLPNTDRGQLLITLRRAERLLDTTAHKVESVTKEIAPALAPEAAQWTKAVSALEPEVRDMVAGMAESTLSRWLKGIDAPKEAFTLLGALDLYAHEPTNRSMEADIVPEVLNALVVLGGSWGINQDSYTIAREVVPMPGGAVPVQKGE